MLKAVLVGLAVLLLIALALFSLLYFTFLREISRTGNPRRYPGLVKGNGQFPASIDKKAEDAAFFYQPGYLQGGTALALRLRLADAEIKRILAGLIASGREEIPCGKGQSPSSYCFPEFGIKKLSGKDAFEGMGELPPGFRVFLCGMTSDDVRRNGNHGQTAFTAVSTERREVVYFSESW